MRVSIKVKGEKKDHSLHNSLQANMDESIRNTLKAFLSHPLGGCEWRILQCHLIFTLQIKHRRDFSVKPAICMWPFILLNTYQMGVKLLPGRVW